MKWLSSLLLLLVAGCVPAPPTTQSEKPIAPTSLGLASETAPPISDQWWSDLGDPQLDRLVGEALTGSPTLAAALARVRAAQAQVSGARSQLYPQVSLLNRRNQCPRAASARKHTSHDPCESCRDCP